MKALAVLLYGMGGMSFSMIGRVLGVSDVAVLKWVRAEAAALPEPVVPSTVMTVEVDEMWHVLNKGLPRSGSGSFDVTREVVEEASARCLVGRGSMAARFHAAAASRRSLASQRSLPIHDRALGSIEARSVIYGLPQ